MGYNLTENLFGYTLVQDILVESATTSVTFSGLNYTVADDLLLVSDFANANASYQSLYLYANSLTSNTSYMIQRLNAKAQYVEAFRENYFGFTNCEGTNKSFSTTKIKLTNSSYFVWQSDIESEYQGSTNKIFSLYGTSLSTLTNLTSLTLTASATNAIGIGSRFRLYKLNATKVADITVGTATTSVDITGLNITKDSEYMLVSDVVGNVSSSFGLFINSNTTNTNYWTQELGANGTGVFGGRVNHNKYLEKSGATNYDKSFAMVNLKLTNNGNYVFQSTTNQYYGASNIMIENWNCTSTFTATSITQLTISATATNGIGVGSRFQLYRMKG